MSEATEQKSSDRIVLKGPLFRRQGRRVELRDAQPVALERRAPVRRPAKVARMLALAHHLQRAIDQGRVADQAEVARKLGLTRARITQLFDLLILAPDLQDQVLALEAVDGREPVVERRLREVAHSGAWAKQRAAWALRQPNRLSSAVASVGRSQVDRPRVDRPDVDRPSPTPEQARAAFQAIADHIAALRVLPLDGLEVKHLELFGAPCAIRSRDALTKKISLEMQRRAFDDLVRVSHP